MPNPRDKRGQSSQMVLAGSGTGKATTGVTSLQLVSCKYLKRVGQVQVDPGHLGS